MHMKVRGSSPRPSTTEPPARAERPSCAREGARAHRMREDSNVASASSRHTPTTPGGGPAERDGAGGGGGDSAEAVPPPRRRRAPMLSLSAAGAEAGRTGEARAGTHERKIGLCPGSSTSSVRSRVRRPHRHAACRFRTTAIAWSSVFVVPHPPSCRLRCSPAPNTSRRVHGGLDCRPCLRTRTALSTPRQSFRIGVAMMLKRRRPMPPSPRHSSLLAGWPSTSRRRDCHRRCRAESRPRPCALRPSSRP